VDSSAPSWKTLGEWGATCATIDPVGLAATVAPVFLVCKPGSALQVPEGPQATMRVDLRLVEAAKRGEFHYGCPVWPLRRREDSVYSFISVGRTHNCDVQISDGGISKLHSIVRESDGQITVNDAGSRNKTFVDGVEAPRRGDGDPLPAPPGTTVRFGSIDTVVMTAAELHKLALSLRQPS